MKTRKIFILLIVFLLVMILALTSNTLSVPGKRTSRYMAAREKARGKGNK
jgi:hypothetical protein